MDGDRKNLTTKIMNTYYSIRLHAASLGLACFEIRSHPFAFGMQNPSDIPSTIYLEYKLRNSFFSRKIRSGRVVELFVKDWSTLVVQVSGISRHTLHPALAEPTEKNVFTYLCTHIFSHQQIPAAHPKLISFSLRLSPFIKSGNFA